MLGCARFAKDRAQGMTSAVPKLPTAMTVEEFIAWPGDGEGGRYQLVDGELRPMSPATVTHGTIQSNLAGIIRDHLDAPGNRCRVVTEPAVAVRIRARHNLRVPDLGVSCAPDGPGEVELSDPVLLIEILSPGNARETMDNVWAYTTIPTLKEILIVHAATIRAELLRREAGGSWPATPEEVGAADVLRLSSIGYEGPLRAAYGKTYLAG